MLSTLPTLAARVQTAVPSTFKRDLLEWIFDHRGSYLFLEIGV